MPDRLSGKPIAIVGAGLAGLTVAVYLKRRGVPFILYEAGPSVGGLASSTRDEEGYSYDFGAHFITNRLAAALGLGSRCRTLEHYGESVWMDGKAYSYPFGLLRQFKFLRSGIASFFRKSDPLETSTSAAEWFARTYGDELASQVAVPLLESWSGVPATDLAPSVGQKLRHSISRTMFLAASARLSGRAVACGYSHEAPENPNVWHVYPESGLGLVCQRLAEEVASLIRLDSPVEQILVDSDRVVAVSSRGRLDPVAGVVSTAPCPLLSRMIRGTGALGALARFRYRPMVFVNLKLRGRALLPNTVLWIPDRSFPFFRLTEAPRSMPWLAPEGRTIITADLGCEVGSKTWTMSDEELAREVLRHLSRLVPDASRRYLGCRALRTPIAYPLYLREYEPDRIRFSQSLQVTGMLAVGRNAEFAHLLMEDVYWRTLRRSREFVLTLEAMKHGRGPLAQAS